METIIQTCRATNEIFVNKHVLPIYQAYTYIHLYSNNRGMRYRNCFDMLSMFKKSGEIV